MTPEALSARTLNEVRCFFLVQRCGACGKGPLTAPLPAGGGYRGPLTVAARCQGCHHEQAYDFTVEQAVGSQRPASDVINPTDEPSRIIDLAGWLGLFYMLLTLADRQEAPGRRLLGHQAALCLGEALKFYGDDELPAVSAFFSDESQQAFREHPEKFARQRLRDMQAKLPSLSAMQERLVQDRRATRRRWWQFWRADDQGSGNAQR